MFSPLFKTALMLISVLSLMSFSFGKKIPKGTYNATFEIKEGSKTSDIKMDKVTTKISVKVNGDTSDEVAKMLEQEIQNIGNGVYVPTEYLRSYGVKLLEEKHKVYTTIFQAQTEALFSKDK